VWKPFGWGAADFASRPTWGGRPDGCTQGQAKLDCAKQKKSLLQAAEKLLLTV
jgi:hypothetical protein